MRRHADDYRLQLRGEDDGRRQIVENNHDQYRVSYHNRRDEQIRQYFGTIMSNQLTYIKVITKKNHKLKIIILILIILMVIIYVSGSGCEFNNDQDTKQIQKICMERYRQLNCNSSDKKMNQKYSKQCHQIQQCLKNPLMHKMKLENEKLQKFYDEIYYYLDILKNKFSWGCFIGLLITVLDYFRHP